MVRSEPSGARITLEDPLMQAENMYQHSLRHATKEMMDRTFTVKTWGVFFTDEFGRKIELDGIEDMGHALEVYETALYKGWTDIVMYETFAQKSIVKYETHP